MSMKRLPGAVADDRRLEDTRGAALSASRILSEPDMRGRWLALLDKTGERKIRVIGKDGQDDFLVKNE